MTTFNVSRFTRSIGCFAAVTAALLSASTTHAGSATGLLRAPDASRISNAIATFRATSPSLPPKPRTAPSPTPPRYYDSNRVRQEMANGTYGGGCFGNPRLPQSALEQLRPLPVVRPVPLPTPIHTPWDEWPKLKTTSTQRPLPNHVPGHHRLPQR